jgi:serine/threonine protein kinase
MDERETLLRIAASVVDDDAVDWESLRQQHVDLSDDLDLLRRIERIRRAHQELGGSSSGALQPGTSWGPLTIVQRIGGGGFGDVYRAHDPMLQKDVALKLLRVGRRPSERSEATILREARRLASVRHPNVLTVHGAAEQDGRVGLWTDLIRGKTLETILQQDGRMSAEEAALIGCDLCRALAAVHAANLVHRDVKTENVMREAGGRIVLMDFGLVVERPSTGLADTRASLSGTPRFMAPELFRGQDSGVAADVYALGVVLYRLVSSRFPFEGALRELVEAHRRGDAPVPLRDVRSDLPSRFVRIVERALERDPERRYASAGEMERDLAECLAGTSQPTSPPAVDREPKPRRRIAAAAALLALAAIVVLVAMLWPRSFDVDVGLYRPRGDTEERLTQGTRVAPGDPLFLEIEADRAFHAYVLTGDERGNTFLLFPLEGLELQNPLRKGVSHRLPGAAREGDEQYWRVTSVGGSEYILVVASRNPLPELEQRIAEIPPASPGEPLELGDPSLVTRLRGIGGLTQVDPDRQPDRSSIIDIGERIGLRRGGSANVRVWELWLRNPGPAGP